MGGLKAEREADFDAWLAAFDAAWRAPAEVGHLACPTCTERCLALVYFRKPRSEREGMYAFWCAACLTGFPPGFGPIPDGAAVEPFERRSEVPNYACAVPS